MKILNLCFSDMAGSAYTLSHAINKHTEHQSINLRSSTNYVRYPAFAGMRYYDMATCQQIVYKADAIVFHSAVRPFYTGLGLEKAKLRDKKKLLYFHGSELRFHGDELIDQAKEYMEDYQILISTPDLFLYAPPEAEWLPVCRSFTEIKQRYTLCNQDKKALKTFDIAKKKVVFSHAVTDEWKKGSKIFYKIITKAIKELPQIEYTAIQRLSWNECLNVLSDVDVYFDQAPPFLGSYGCLAVEASIFKIPVLCQLTTKVQDLIKEKTGREVPFISFRDENDLLKQVFALALSEKIRRREGLLGYRYCKALHDEKPVVNKFLKIIGDMNG